MANLRPRQMWLRYLIAAVLGCLTAKFGVEVADYTNDVASVVLAS
jgi:hypothetical protein